MASRFKEYKLRQKKEKYMKSFGVKEYKSINHKPIKRNKENIVA